MRDAGERHGLSILDLYEQHRGARRYQRPRGRHVNACPLLLDCPSCGATVWRPAGSRTCWECEGRPQAAPLAHTTGPAAIVDAIHRAGFRLTAGADGIRVWDASRRRGELRMPTSLLFDLARERDAVLGLLLPITEAADA